MRANVFDRRVFCDCELITYKFCKKVSSFIALFFVLQSCILSYSYAETVSGTVFQSDGVTPLTGESIEIWLDYNDCMMFGMMPLTATVNPVNGTYTVNGVSPGTYYLQATPSGSYASEFWATPSSVGDCLQAGEVIVSVGNNVTDINFQFDGKTSFPWTMFLPTLINSAKP